MKNLLRLPLRRFLPILLGLLTLPAVRASDLGDAPSTAQDQGADLGDAYFFLDPTDNTKAILALTVHGFIVPGLGVSVATFDPKVKFAFEIENTGDAIPEKKLRVSFAAPSAPGAPQMAHVSGSGINFFAPTTPATLVAAAPASTVTADAASGFQFFAGPVDDPFFCDLVAVHRYLDSAGRGALDPAMLARGRDTFAGYNILGLAISVPISFLQGPSASIGLHAVAKRRVQTPSKSGGYTVDGSFVTVDRVGVPGVNALFVPPARRDEYNAAKPADDAAGKFSADLAAVLQSLGTSDVFISILKSFSVSKGDYLRLNVGIANTGAGGGTNPAAGFPNGRRLQDDVIDTLLTFVNNGSPLSDHVNANDVAPQDRFPFFAPPHQPLPAGAADATQN